MNQRGPRIVVDARMAFDGGIGTYLQQLVPRIAARRRHWQFVMMGDESRMRGLGWSGHDNLALLQSSAPIFSLREQVELPFRIAGRADLYWAPNYCVPVLAPVPMVVTIHDVNHIAMPEFMGSPLRRVYARWMISNALERAERVLFDSEFTRAEARRLLAPRSVDGTVVHLGVDARWERARELAPERPLPEPYLLYVGNVKRHKNVPFLLRAFGRIATRVPHRLLLVGRTEGLRADPGVARALAALRDRAQLLGEVAPDAVLRYVAHADALVTASLYEGFGLPALEAMAAGCPCVVSRAGSLPEICGDAALYADPYDEKSFADRLLEIVECPDVRTTLAARGRERAARFSWDRAADLTTAVFEEVLR